MSRLAWTPAEDAILDAHYSTGGSAVVATMTGRTRDAVRHRARILGKDVRPVWTDLEEKRLRNLWGLAPVRQLAKKLGRSPKAVYWHATEVLGLSAGPPDGCEYIQVAADRLGVAGPTLKRILKWARVEKHASMTDPARRQERNPMRRCVDSFEATEAVKAWCDSEKLNEAARRRGVGVWHLRTLLKGMKGVPRKPRGKRHWRIPSRLIDEALAGERKAA